MAAPTGCWVECKLDSAFDLVALLTALQLREKEQKDQRVHCEVSNRGLKFVAQSLGKDVAALGWMFKSAFAEYRLSDENEELHLKLPVAPLLSCLQIFSERAALSFRYPSGSNENELCFKLQDDNAVTECRLKTLVADEAPSHITLFAPDDENRYYSVFRLAQPDSWHQALSEFEGIDAPDVVLKLTLRRPPPDALPAGLPADHVAVVLRAQTITSDAEIELKQRCFLEFTIAPDVIGDEITHQYLLSGVLSSSLRASKDARAVKVRINSQGVMSTQFILRSRGQCGQKDQLYCEALVCPLSAAFVGPGGLVGDANPAPSVGGSHGVQPTPADGVGHNNPYSFNTQC